MDEHRQSFIDETGDLMNHTEQYLLLLENEPDNVELIDAVYRSVHSLKGIAGMFEFEQIAEVSHKLESVLSEVKETDGHFKPEMSDLSFLYIDFVKRSLREDTANSDVDALYHTIMHKIEEILPDPDAAAADDRLKTHYLLLRPNADFEERGIKLEPIFSLLEENFRFKKFEKITSAEDMQSKFYMFWEYIIVSPKEAGSISEDILLHDDEILVKKIADADLLESDNTDALLEYFDDPQTCADLEKITQEFGKAQKKQKRKAVENKTVAKPREDLEQTLVEYEVSGINVASDKLDNLMNYVSELISSKEAIAIYAQKINDSGFSELTEMLDKTTNLIKDTALSMRLIPLESIMIKYKRLVRDLSKKHDKEIVFETDGTNTELDKTVINMLAEPLMHIIRNSIDHGIEQPEERAKAGKPKQGRIKLFASNEGNEVILQIHDDGRGIDPEVVRQKAIEKGLIEDDSTLSKRDILNIIFMPGFSTAQKVSGISGRGVGMDVVKQKITDIRGDIEIDSEPGLGTYVTLKLPMTLSIIETLQVEINGYNYLIPQNVITNVDSIEQHELENNKKNLLELHGQMIPLIDLTKKFKKIGKLSEKQTKRIVSVMYKDRRIGLITDRIVGDHQAVLKPLGELFKDKESFSGAGILGDGSLALMIDTNKLLKGMKTT